MNLEELMASTPPMQQHALIKGFQAGAASRDAEVVSLTNQRDYEYVRAENAEQERDQLREQVKMLRDGRQAEREECAKVCDKLAYEWRGANSRIVECAAAIRARGDTK